MVTHRLLEGDNEPIMEQLISGGERFDAIYLDPPYNTGGFLTFSDQRGRSTAARSPHRSHDEWLGFMKPRLTLCRNLLTPEGVLIMSIGDGEIPHARMLLDQIFGENNCLGTVVWDGTAVISNARFLSTTHSYLLFYALDWRKISRWRVPKPRVGELLDYAKQLVRNYDLDAAQTRWRQHLRANGFPKGVRAYRNLTAEGRPWREASLASPGTSQYQYEVVHPETGMPCRLPKRGWRCTEDTFADLNAQGLIAFGGDADVIPQRIYYLDENLTEPPRSVFQSPSARAATHVADLLGLSHCPFSYPKDHEVLAYWLTLATSNNPQARVLDPFAGSGSTIEAVMMMNEDGGARHATGITLDEQVANPRQAGVDGLSRSFIESTFYGVTVPRLEAALSGLRPDGTRWGDGHPGQELHVIARNHST